MLPVGAAGAGGVYAWARRRGRNEVYAGGAADAAYGPAHRCRRPARRRPRSASSPTRTWASWRRRSSSRRRASSRGRAPVLLRERIDDDTVSAWFSGQAARDVITITKDGDDHVVLGVGPRFADAGGEDAADPAAGCSTAQPRSRSTATTRTSPRRGGRCVPRPSGRSPARGSGSGSRRPAAAARPGSPCRSSSSPARGCSSAPARWRQRCSAGSPGRSGRSPFGLVVPALAAFAMYRSLLPARSADGQRAGPAHRVVPTFPRRERGPPRRVGVDPRPAARVLGVGGRPRRGVDVGAGDGRVERPADGAVHRDRCSCTAWARRSPAATRRRRARAAPGGPAAGSPAAVSEAGAAAAAPAPGRRATDPDGGPPACYGSPRGTMGARVAALHDTATYTDLVLTALRRYPDRIAFSQDGHELTLPPGRGPHRPAGGDARRPWPRRRRRRRDPLPEPPGGLRRAGRRGVRRRPVHGPAPARLARRPLLRVRRGRAADPARRSGLRGARRRPAGALPDGRDGVHVRACRRRRGPRCRPRRRPRRRRCAGGCASPRTSRGCSTRAARPACRRRRCCPSGRSPRWPSRCRSAGTSPPTGATWRARRSPTPPGCSSRRCCCPAARWC